MLNRLTPWLRVVSLVLIVGGAISLTSFFVTSQHRQFTYLGPLCARDLALPAFDPWTGAPHGRIYEVSEPCPPASAGTTYRLVVVSIPREMLGRQAIPVPVGFVSGCAFAVIGIGLGVVLVGRRRLGPGRPQAPA
jgi:hypothetical protein